MLNNESCTSVRCFRKGNELRKLCGILVFDDAPNEVGICKERNIHTRENFPRKITSGAALDENYKFLEIGASEVIKYGDTLC
jgi:hypothetical protein